MVFLSYDGKFEVLEQSNGSFKFLDIVGSGTILRYLDNKSNSSPYMLSFISYVTLII